MHVISGERGIDMVIDYNDMLFSFSEAVDIIDKEVTGSTTNHGKRVAYMIPVIYEVASDKGSLVYLVTTLALVLVSALNQKQTTALLHSLNADTTMLLILIAAAVVINIISVEISARIFNDRVWK